MRRSTRAHHLVVGAAAGLLLSACGGGGSSAADTSAADDLGGCVSPAEAGAPAAAGTVEKDKYKGITVTWASSGGPFQEAQKAALACFSSTAGSTSADDATDYAKIAEGVKAGNSIDDVVDTDVNWAVQNCGTLFQPLDYSIIDISKVPTDTPVSECVVPAMQYGYLLVYNAEVYKNNPPKTWADFFDTKKFPGKRAIQGIPDQTPGLFEGALLADGVPPDRLYPLDYDRALKKLDTIADETIFWSTGAQSADMMTTGEASMGLLWSGRAAYAGKTTPLKVMWDQSFKLYDVLAVPKHVKNRDAAMAAINYYLGAQSQTILAENAPGNSPVNTDSRPDITGTDLDFLTTSPEAEAALIRPDWEWWAKNAQQATEEYGTWLNQ
jgi:putative spermidine/putrescine transport system substrate-binding protein